MNKSLSGCNRIEKATEMCMMYYKYCQCIKVCLGVCGGSRTVASGVEGRNYRAVCVGPRQRSVKVEE